jgi:hypothetical protein
MRVFFFPRLLVTSTRMRFGKCAHTLVIVAKFIGKHVGMDISNCGKMPYFFFATLCEIPMGMKPSVYSSVIVEKSIGKRVDMDVGNYGKMP